MNDAKTAIAVTLLLMASIAGGFWLGYNAGQSDVMMKCARNGEFQRGDAYILCEMED